MLTALSLASALFPACRPRAPPVCPPPPRTVFVRLGGRARGPHAPGSGGAVTALPHRTLHCGGWRPSRACIAVAAATSPRLHPPPPSNPPPPQQDLYPPAPTGLVPPCPACPLVPPFETRTPHPLPRPPPTVFYGKPPSLLRGAVASPLSPYPRTERARRRAGPRPWRLTCLLPASCCSKGRRPFTTFKPPRTWQRRAGGRWGGGWLREAACVCGAAGRGAGRQERRLLPFPAPPRTGAAFFRRVP